MAAATEGMDGRTCENIVCGKRKEWLERERPGGNELVVRGFMEEDLGSFLEGLFLCTKEA